MYFKQFLILLSTAYFVKGQPGKCDQTPPQATRLEPMEDNEIYHLAIQNAPLKEGKRTYTPDQTYVLSIYTTSRIRPFRSFMITAEDPDVDRNVFDFSQRNADVGTLKTLDVKSSRYSERCASSIENVDNADKYNVEIQWVSPKQSDKDQTVRIRAMVAENNEAWYTGDELTVVLYKDTERSRDSPPFDPIKDCNLCSEARYEVIFAGQWSRVAHPRHYPSKPDENGYSHMVGASHHYDYALWQQGSSASEGLQKLAEEANTTVLEREIIDVMAEKTGTRTLIRGKRRFHPYMSEPSHALFRVDRYHHMFSIAVALRPSPDWFLGTSKFELCTENGWFEGSKIPLYPWDAGTMDGVSYESQTTVSVPKDTVERVEVGSFNEESPFYQMNLNDLKPFAWLTVRRLDVFPLIGAECSEDDGEENGEASEVQEEGEGEDEEEEEEDDEPEEPTIGEVKQDLGDERCSPGEWSAWSPCSLDEGNCGTGLRMRTRKRIDKSILYGDYDYQDSQQAQPMTSTCEGEQHAKLVEYQNCFVNCY